MVTLNHHPCLEGECLGIGAVRHEAQHEESAAGTIPLLNTNGYGVRIVHSQEIVDRAGAGEVVGGGGLGGQGSVIDLLFHGRYLSFSYYAFSRSKQFMRGRALAIHTHVIVSRDFYPGGEAEPSGSGAGIAVRVGAQQKTRHSDEAVASEPLQTKQGSTIS